MPNQYEDTELTAQEASKKTLAALLLAVQRDVDGADAYVGYAMHDIARHYEQEATRRELQAYKSVKDGYSFIEWERLKGLKLPDGTKTPLWFVDLRIKELEAMCQSLNNKEVQ